MSATLIQKNQSRALPPYLVLLRVGFALPAPLLARRCALTAPFHPYLGVVVGALRGCVPRARIVRKIRGRFAQHAQILRFAQDDKVPTTTPGRYVFCGTFRPSGLNLTSRTLSGTLLCGVRTFLSSRPKTQEATVRSGCLRSLLYDVGCVWPESARRRADSVTSSGVPYFGHAWSCADKLTSDSCRPTLKPESGSRKPNS